MAEKKNMAHKTIYTKLNEYWETYNVYVLCKGASACGGNATVVCITCCLCLHVLSPCLTI